MAVILHERRRLSEREAAAYLGLSPRTLQDWRTKGVGAAYSKLGRRVSYAIEDLDAFIASARVEPKSMVAHAIEGEG